MCTAVPVTAARRRGHPDGASLQRQVLLDGDCPRARHLTEGTGPHCTSDDADRRVIARRQWVNGEGRWRSRTALTWPSRPASTSSPPRAAMCSPFASCARASTPRRARCERRSVAGVAMMATGLRAVGAHGRRAANGLVVGKVRPRGDRPAVRHLPELRTPNSDNGRARDGDARAASRCTEADRAGMKPPRAPWSGAARSDASWLTRTGTGNARESRGLRACVPNGVQGCGVLMTHATRRVPAGIHVHVLVGWRGQAIAA